MTRPGLKISILCAVKNSNSVMGLHALVCFSLLSFSALLQIVNSNKTTLTFNCDYCYVIDHIEHRVVGRNIHPQHGKRE